jgi:hypothetical protein
MCSEDLSLIVDLFGAGMVRLSERQEKSVVALLQAGSMASLKAKLESGNGKRNPPSDTLQDAINLVCEKFRSIA